MSLRTESKNFSMQQTTIQSDHFIQEILTTILHQRPPNSKQFILQCLKNVQRVKPDDPHSHQIYQFPEPFLTTDDFEAIFDSYDVLSIQTVPKEYLIQGKQTFSKLYIALGVVGVDKGVEVLMEKYPELV